MKKLSMILMCAFCAAFFASCTTSEYKTFVGTWGVVQIQYYNVDYAGNPIASTISTLDYDPEDIGHGIQLIFRDDKTGELRDNDIDTVGVNYNFETGAFESYVYNPDTTLVHTFTYSYDKASSALYLNMKYTYPYAYSRTFMMKITDLNSDSFTYQNEYEDNYVERAYMKRISAVPSKSTGKSQAARPRKPGTFLGGR